MTDDEQRFLRELKAGWHQLRPVDPWKAHLVFIPDKRPVTVEAIVANRIIYHLSLYYGRN